MDTETNPGVEDAAEVEELLTEEATEAEETDNPEGETEEPETVDVERDGKTYRVPAELKDDFLRQGDYTRKTQELAAERKELEAVRERVQQSGEAEVSAKATIIAIEAAMQQYQGVDWDALEVNDPVAAQRHFRQFMQLQNALGEAQTQHKTAIEQRTFETQQEAAKRIEQGLAELERDIPGWGPERAEKLMAFGEKQFGFSREYMENITDPRLVKVMNYAFQGMKPSTKPAAPNIQPAAKVKGGAVPRVGLDDNLSAEEWTRRRNAQLQRK